MKYTKQQLEICYLVWGCVPIDYNWVIKSHLFITKLKQS